VKPDLGIGIFNAAKNFLRPSGFVYYALKFEKPIYLKVAGKANGFLSHVQYVKNCLPFRRVPINGRNATKHRHLSKNKSNLYEMLPV
jgi:hypothetical protein